MAISTLVISGALIGLSVTAPIGPAAILCINRTLARGLPTGISTGAGASTVQAGYCSILLFSMHEAGPWLGDHRATLTLVGGVLMVLLGIRALNTQKKVVLERATPTGSLLVAYVSAVTFSVFNPMTLILLTGALAANLDVQLPKGSEIVFILGGLFCGSIAWWMFLTSATAVAGHRLNDRALITVNRAAASGLIGFGVLAIGRLVFA